MSFPSVVAVAAEQGFTPGNIPPEKAEMILLEAVMRDCKEAVDFLHGLAHKAEQTGEAVQWDVPLGEPLYKQLIRIHAVEPVRKLIQEHVCHGQKLSFYNCHIGTVGGKPKSAAQEALFQIECQDGTVAYMDC